MPTSWADVTWDGAICARAAGVGVFIGAVAGSGGVPVVQYSVAIPGTGVVASGGGLVEVAVEVVGIICNSIDTGGISVFTLGIRRSGAWCVFEEAGGRMVGV